MIDNAEQLQVVSFEKYLIPFNIDGRIDYINTLITEYGEKVFAVGDYVVSFNGGTYKDASNKFTRLYTAIPMLRPPNQDLCHYSKVFIGICIYIQLY